MKRWQKIMIVAAVSLLALALLFCGYERVFRHRSGMAGIAEIAQRISNRGITTAEEEDRLAQQKASGAELTADPDKMSHDAALTTETVAGRQVWHLNADSTEPVKILYIHGGAYVYEISDYQLSLADKLAVKTGAEVIIPEYGLAPFYTWQDGYALVEEVYTDLLEDDPDAVIYLMGDSAGGGLALGFAQSLAEQGIEEPEGLILLSPWVDVTISNPDAADYAAVDPCLCADSLIADGACWAGELDPSDPRISPINGDMEGLPRTLLFTGTRELFYPDEMLLNEKLQAAGVDTTFVIGEGMNHVYPIFPIPEADEAIRTIVAFME